MDGIKEWFKILFFAKIFYSMRVWICHVFRIFYSTFSLSSVLLYNQLSLRRISKYSTFFKRDLGITTTMVFIYLAFLKFSAILPDDNLLSEWSLAILSLYSQNNARWRWISILIYFASSRQQWGSSIAKREQDLSESTLQHFSDSLYMTRKH